MNRRSERFGGKEKVAMGSRSPTGFRAEARPPSKSNQKMSGRVGKRDQTLKTRLWGKKGVKKGCWETGIERRRFWGATTKSKFNCLSEKTKSWGEGKGGPRGREGGGVLKDKVQMSKNLVSSSDVCFITDCLEPIRGGKRGVSLHPWKLRKCRKRGSFREG